MNQETILHKLYAGELYPAEQIKVLTPEYLQIVQQQEQCYEEFCRKLNQIDPSLRRQFEAVLDRHLDAFPHELAETFVQGFRLGAKMMMDIYGDDQKMPVRPEQ